MVSHRRLLNPTQVGSLLREAREATAGSQGPLGFLTPDGHERGARAHGAGEEDLQVPAAAVGERQLDLHVLERADEAVA